jgi:hypothetical protein
MSCRETHRYPAAERVTDEDWRLIEKIEDFDDHVGIFIGPDDLGRRW